MSRDIKKFEQEVYDKWADTYDCSCWAGWIMSWVDNFAGEIPEESSVIDIGCGTGNVLLLLLKRSPLLLAGIDISPKAVTKARNKLSKLSSDIRVGDAESGLPWSDETFDAAVMTAAIHHFPNPEQVLHEVFRVLKPKGRLIIADPFFFFPILQVINLLLRIYPLHGDLHFFSQRGFRTLVERCGFEKVEQKPAGFFAKYTMAFRPDSKGSS